MSEIIQKIRLTQFSHGAGCGCKLAPAVLDKILANRVTVGDAASKLLVGNSSRDDAGAYDLGNGQVLLTTTDFFMPIVDDPQEFGAIAAANAISDIYAMGGSPVMAIAILGWPIDKLAPEIAGEVMAGGQKVLAATGAALAGGHSIDNPEPIFGLAVNGLVARENLKENSGAKPGDLLFLTKPLGVGILSTAEKRGLLRPEDKGVGARSMVKLNSVGARLGKIRGVRAMTDVTGFGLLGHLLEMCRGSKVNARIEFSTVPLLTELAPYLDAGAIPGGTKRNLASYGEYVGELNERARWILSDPQTSGGLLIAVAQESVEEVRKELKEAGLAAFLEPIGEVVERQGLAPYIEVVH